MIIWKFFFSGMKGCHGQCQNGATCKVGLHLRFHLSVHDCRSDAVLTASSSSSVPQEVARGYHCQCPPGFVGTHCEIQRNKCDSEPCQNGGRCHAVLDGFVCECLPEFGGQLCEVSVMFHVSHIEQD